MASCAQCGNQLEAEAQFCSRCGQRLGANAVPARHRGRRVVLALLAVVAVAGLAFVIGTVYFIRHTTIVTSTKNGGRVESPYGVVTTNNDPAKLAQSLGLDLFPGAVGEKGTQAELGNSIMVSLTFRTSATPRQVISFYHVRYPDATVAARDNQISLVLVSLRDTLTIRAAPSAGHTTIEVSDIRH